MNNNTNSYPILYPSNSNMLINNFSNNITPQPLDQIINQSIIDQMKKYNDNEKVIKEFSKNRLNDIRKIQLNAKK